MLYAAAKAAMPGGSAGRVPVTRLSVMLKYTMELGSGGMVPLMALPPIDRNTREDWEKLAGSGPVRMAAGAAGEGRGSEGRKSEG